MAAMPPHDLLKAWKQDTMPVEMTLGHVVQNLVILREDIDRLLAHTRMPPNPKGNRKPSKPDETPDPEQPS